MAFPITKKTLSITIAETEAVATATTDVNGRLRAVLVDAADLDDTDTYTVAITSPEGFTVFTQGSLVKDAKSQIFADANDFPLDLPLEGESTVTITASGAQSVESAFIVYLLVDQK